LNDGQTETTENYCKCEHSTVYAVGLYTSLGLVHRLKDKKRNCRLEIVDGAMWNLKK